MDPTYAIWRRRHKRLSRRLRREIRVFLPMISVLFCFGSSATTIISAEKVPLLTRPGVDEPLSSEEVVAGYSITSISSTSKLSAAPAGIRPAALLP